MLARRKYRSAPWPVCGIAEFELKMNIGTPWLVGPVRGWNDI
jgi:hypothetical protein